MMLVKASKDSDAGVMPDDSPIAAQLEGGASKFSGGRPIVVDGPFAETKELIAGYWRIQVKSKEEAIDWAKRCASPHGAAGEGEIELRQVFELEDFAPSATIEHARRLDRELGKK